MSIKQGDVVYTKTAIVLGDKVQITHKVSKGYFGFVTIVLGALKSKNKRPTRKELKDAMGQIGYVTFDDIQTVLGEKAMRKVFDYVDKEYRPNA